MAVQAVNGITEATPSAVVDKTQQAGNGQKDYAKMTAKEIIEADKNGESIPAQILTWAKENPEIKTTYAEAQGDTGEGAVEENDAVAYQVSLEEQGMSLKDQCKQFTQLSAQKEERDLKNITKMGPYMQQVPTDEQDGTSSTSEVTKALDEIRKDMKGGSIFSRGGINNITERIKFYQALNKGTSGELGVIDFSLEEIQSVLDTAISDAADSKQYGDETTKLGRELKSSSKFWKFSKRKAARKAIEQGDKTVKMAERTDKLAQAVAKDNGVAIKSTKDNIRTVGTAVLEEGQTDKTGTTTETATANVPGAATP